MQYPELLSGYNYLFPSQLFHLSCNTLAVTTIISQPMKFRSITCCIKRRENRGEVRQTLFVLGVCGVFSSNGSVPLNGVHRVKPLLSAICGHHVSCIIVLEKITKVMYRTLPSLIFVVLAVIVLVFEQFPSITAHSCVAKVSPVATTSSSMVNCSNVACSWNIALEWCSKNESGSSVWMLVLESGVYSFEEETPSPVQIPLGLSTCFFSLTCFETGRKE